MEISVVSPVYKAPLILEELVDRLQTTLNNICNSYEIILIDDGCPLNSWNIIENLVSCNSHVRGIKLSRNFGQHYAISAGLENATGDWIIVLDCDLQDKPEEIQKLYIKAKEGFDIVLASREYRQDNFWKKYTSKQFHKILTYLTGNVQDYKLSNFGIYSRKVITAINSCKDPIRYFPSLLQKVGFKSITIGVEHNTRREGESSYNLMRLLKLGLDVVLSNSEKPIRLIVKLGVLISALSFGFGLLVVYQWYNNQITITGYSSVIISICFFSGIIIFTLGIIGLYIGKTFEAVKFRPPYFIDKII